MKKKIFRYNERFAIWECHDKKCWMCGQPLRLLNFCVDHVLPESLLAHDAKRIEVIQRFGLPSTFKINGFENWLPACFKCNNEKGEEIPEFWLKNQRILDRLVKKADWVRKVSEEVPNNVTKDKILRAIFSALERQSISIADLESFMLDIIVTPQKVGVPEDVIILNDGFWRKRATIVREGLCACDRNECVGRHDKVYCYFHDGLSEWVIKKGLFFSCYDEQVQCSRCGHVHKRGHTGRLCSCAVPFADQSNQRD